MPPPLGKYELLLGLGETIKRKGEGTNEEGEGKGGEGEKMNHKKKQNKKSIRNTS